MSRQNSIFLYARVVKSPIIMQNPETEEYDQGAVYVDVVRSDREVDDAVHFVKHDHPLIITRNPSLLEEMKGWQVNDVVYVKGVISTKKIAKHSRCTFCKDEDGIPFRNTMEGNMVYVTPIFMEKIRSYEKKSDAIEDVIKHKEISNQAYIIGTLLKDPKIVKTKQCVQFTQYPIAINRKYNIRTDDPSIRTDWPVVKSYGEQAREDKTYLKYQADVMIDGFLQVRTVTRKCKCANCGQIYEWDDRSMEIVPYDVEYLSGYKTKEEAEEEYECTVDEYKQILFTSYKSDALDEDMKTKDIEEG